jgi:RNA polymerase sigma-70 factor (ECF subfamily)
MTPLAVPVPATLAPRAAAAAPVALVAAARDGSVGAFEALYRANVGRIHGLCLRLTADRDLAAQLTQDTFVRAWEKLDGFRGESRFETWLHRLAINVVLDWRRQRDRRERREIGTDDDQALESAAIGRSVPAPAVAERLDLERAVARLPEGARTIFVLFEIEGYPLRDIAEIEGIAEGTVKAQLHRARQILREALR